MQNYFGYLWKNIGPLFIATFGHTDDDDEQLFHMKQRANNLIIKSITRASSSKYKSYS